MIDDTLGIVLFGGGVVAASALARRLSRPDLRLTSLSGRWVSPVPNLGDRAAVISNPFRAQGDANQHLGVDLMFQRRDARDLIAVYPPKTGNGTPMFFMPDGIAALAASAGKVTLATPTPVGQTVIVKHPNSWATYYTHLASLAVKRGDIVRSGQLLGTIGASPLDAAHLVHLHFELWKDGTCASAIDPTPYLAAWSRMTSSWSPAPPVDGRIHRCRAPARRDAERIPIGVPRRRRSWRSLSRVGASAARRVGRVCHPRDRRTHRVRRLQRRALV